MEYIFGEGCIDYPNGLKRQYPYINIQGNLQKYGEFLDSEITHIGSNLEYVKEIVNKLESLLNGELDFYDGFGYEIYMIECDKEKARVLNTFENYTIEAEIPTKELYELMRDWRDYLIEFYRNN